MGKGNKFKKIINHLNSSQIDEKLQLLSEIPANNTTTIYSIEPEKTEVTGENVDAPLDLTQDDPALSGRDTTGLFGEDGSILSIEPPGDTTYVLGPMMSMWYAWGNFSTIGYVRESDRRMVNLGRITGTIANWDGTSNFTSYGQLTLAQAQWYRDQYNSGNTQQYRAFYPGPPSNPADNFGRYLGDIINKAKELAREVVKRFPPINGPWDPDLVPGSAKPKDKKKKDDEPPFDMEAYLNSLPPEVQDDLLNGAVPFDPFIDGLIASLTKAGKVIQSVGALGRAADAWFNKGRNQRIPDERNAPWKKVWDDDWAQRGRTADPKTNPNAPWDPTRGLRPGVPADKGGIGSGPTPLGRRVGELVPKPAISTASSGSKNKNKRGSKTKSKGSRRGAAINNSYDPKGKVLSESKRSILKNIKKPYVLPEEPKLKFKHRPKVNRTINSNLMKQAEVPTSFKRAEERVWGKYEKEQNARWSQERKNQVLDHLGESDHAWEYMTETSRGKNDKIMYGNFDGENKRYEVVRKEDLKSDVLLFIVDEKGKKESILQSDLSCKIADVYDREVFEKYFNEQETMDVDKDPLFKKLSNRLKKEIDYSDKPAKKGYPNDPPPEMVNGWHPDYGKDKGYYNKMDPISAKTMKKVKNIIKNI